MSTPTEPASSRLSALEVAHTDPAHIIELFRGNYATELLVAAVAHLKVFEHLSGGALSFNNLRRKMGLAERPAAVLLTALRAMGLLKKDEDSRVCLTAIANEHLAGGPFDMCDYIGLGAQSPGVLEMLERLNTNRPANADAAAGAAFIYREGIESAMEKEGQARQLTLALAGRSRNIAPVLANLLPMEGTQRLLDVGGGTGIYSIAFLQKNPGLRALVWDRPEVLKVAGEIAAQYGVRTRLQCVEGNMFSDPVPPGADTILLSNVLHDWDEPECRKIIVRLAQALPKHGRIVIHDALLNDAQDGPLPVALYSAALFSLTEGRAYSHAEYATWLAEAGLQVSSAVPTLIHCSFLTGTK
jgi:predicted O-methyltransferase YrrM